MEKSKWMRNKLFILAIQYKVNPCNREFSKVKFIKERLPCLSPRASQYNVAWFYLFNTIDEMTHYRYPEIKQSALLNPSASSKQDFILQTSSFKGSGMTMERRPRPFRCCFPVSTGWLLWRAHITKNSNNNQWMLVKHTKGVAWIKLGYTWNAILCMMRSTSLTHHLVSEWPGSFRRRRSVRNCYKMKRAMRGMS